MFTCRLLSGGKIAVLQIHYDPDRNKQITSNAIGRAADRYYHKPVSSWWDNQQSHDRARQINLKWDIATQGYFRRIKCVSVLQPFDFVITMKAE